MKLLSKMLISAFCILTILGNTPLWATEEEINKPQGFTKTEEDIGLPPDITKKEVINSTQGAPQGESSAGAHTIFVEEKVPGGQQKAQKEEIDKTQTVPIEEKSTSEQVIPKEGSITSGQDLAKGEGFNNGQDFTRPVRRIEVLERYDDMTGSTWSNSVILRAGLPLELRRGWRLSLRAELPYTWTKGISANNPQGESIQGFSEVLAEALFIAPAKDKWTYVVGAQYIPPSASHDELGTGRYQLVPSAGFKYDMSGWMKGAWFAMMARQAVDVAGYSGYSPINQTIIQPMFNINLPDQWFLTFAPECRYDWKKNKGFIPFDVTVGKMITKKIVMSAEYKSAINDDLPFFVNEFDVRVGFFF